MSDINELKEKLITRRMRWMRSETTPDYMISDMADLLIGITEQLEEVKYGIKVPFVPDPNHARARREAMIEALRWAERVTASGGVEYGAFTDAIARLENGGDL